jgi:hypothetical protein
LAKESPTLAAAIQVSDRFICELGFTGLASYPIPKTGSHKTLSGWKILFDGQENAELVEEKLNQCAERLDQTLNGIT